MTLARPRASWWDDLAAICAGAIASAPWAWGIAAAVLALGLGRNEHAVAWGWQIGAGALVGGLLVRVGALRFGTAPLWVLPLVAAVLHLLETPSHFGLGAPLAIAAGAGLALAGVASPARLPVRVGAPLVWGALVAARARVFVVENDYIARAHVLDLGLPVALAAVALMLRGPTPAERAETAPRRPGAGSGRWIAWFLFPALVLYVPYLDLYGVFALALVAFAVRVADHVARPSVDPAAAWERLRARCSESPWTASAVVAAVALAWGSVAWGVADAWLSSAGTHLGAPVAYGGADLSSAIPEAYLLVAALLAHGPLRRAPGAARAAPFLAVLFVPYGLTVSQMLLAVFRYGFTPQDALTVLPGSRFLVAVVPLVTARLVPVRTRAFHVIDAVLLLALVALPVAHDALYRDDPWALMDDPIGMQLAEAVVASLLFHRLATCRIRTRTLAIGAVAAGAATALVLVGLDVDWEHPTFPRPGYTRLPSFDSANQLRVVMPVVTGWLAALVPLLVARGLDALPVVRGDAER